MFISEVGEAIYCGLTAVRELEVNESNYFFSNLVGQYINRKIEIIHKKVKEGYGKLAEFNTVANYNYNRLYLNS